MTGEAKPRGVREVEIANAVFAALAHPARRQILLSVHFRGECTAGDIAKRFSCSWPTTSRHLSTLVAAEILHVEKVGRQRIYRSNAELLAGTLNQWAGYFDRENV